MENNARISGGGLIDPNIDPILPLDEPFLPNDSRMIAVPKTLLTDIGKAIGDKTGNRVPIRVQDMASEIRKIGS